MKTIEIRHRFTSAILFGWNADDSDPNPTRTAVLKAIVADAYLAGADLAGANLADADLAGANLAGANLAGADLAGAYLAGANLARANLADAYLARANLADAYLARANLARANLARANLAGANLADADLAGANLAGANLAGADLAGANLAGANLADADLAGADLADAYLARANLAGADLADAKNRDLAAPRMDPPEPYKRALTDEEHDKRRLERMLKFRERHPEIPVIENLDAKILAAISQPGNSLDMTTWHSCETTHCRAGWAIHLAGKPGYELERKTTAQHAGSQIYRASTGRVPHFFASHERALEDIKHWAQERSAEVSE